MARPCYFDLVAESLRDDIRLVAEGVAVLSAKVDALHSSGRGA